MNSKIASVAFALLAVAFIPTRASMQSPPRVSAAIAQAAADGPVRVIVTLDAPTQPENALADARAVQAQRAAISSAQNAALDRLPGLAEAPTRFQSIAGFAVTTDQAGLAALAEMPSVRSIEPDRLLAPTLFDSTIIIRADLLWAGGTEGSGWKVAILDTGIETSHSFFTGRVTTEACFSTTSSSLGATSFCPGATTGAGTGVNCPSTLTRCDHGTQVAGIAAGRNSLFTGVARSADIISVQVFSRVQGTGLCNGTDGPCAKAFTSDVVQALLYLNSLTDATNSFKIGAVNLSLSEDITDVPPMFSDNCDSSSPSLKSAIDSLRSKGIPTIVAAGNGYNGTTGVGFPACISSAVSVGATAKDGSLAGFSQRPSTAASNFLLAPGFHIFTSTLNNGYQEASGTSMAAAHVSGAWTLLKARLPSANVDKVLEALRGSGVPTTSLQFPRIVAGYAAGSMGPAGSPTSVVAVPVGTTVTTSWANPFDGSNPATYFVEFVSTITGQTAIINGSARQLVTTLPIGSYIVRVHSSTATGPASNDLPFYVGAPASTEAPLAPRDLRAEVDGQMVTLSWNATLESAPVDTFIIDVGSLPGLSNFGSFETGNNALSLVARNVNPGTYFVRVRAKNTFGVSGSSNEVAVYVTGTGCAAIPPPTGLNQTVVGSLVTLNWSPPVTQGAIIGYVIEAGTSPGSTNVLVATTGPATVVSAGAASGTYFVRVRAQTVCGTSAPSNEVTVVVP